MVSNAIEYQTEKQNLSVSGIVIDWMEDYRLGIILQKEDGHYQEIPFNSITRVSDNQYFEDYLNQ